LLWMHFVYCLTWLALDFLSVGVDAIFEAWHFLRVAAGTAGNR